MTENTIPFDQEPKLKTTPEFEKVMSRLNERQRDAVMSIDGPVLVTAGPGTGKTQVLSARVGQILLQTDAQADNVLCLTYTNAGVHAMKKRLLEFLGPTAYNIHVHTFHSLCNEMIQENQYRFDDFLGLTQLSDIEEGKIIQKIIDELPYDSILRNYGKNSRYSSKKQMRNLFNMMQQENLTPVEIISMTDNYIQTKIEEGHKDFVYLSNYGKNKKGDHKESGLHKYDKLKAAAPLYERYTELKKERGFYSYNDMILFVLDKMKNNQDFVFDYQERFQYLLVDEYQDTNGSQNELIYYLTNYDERPNLFVVGDADQSIYRFQGANLENLNQLKDRYPVKQIVLTENYRSNQFILDSAFDLITNNTKRDPAAYEKLVASGPNSSDQTKPCIVEMPNGDLEADYVVREIKRLHEEESIDYNQMAILYRQHSQAEPIQKLLEADPIPYQLKKSMNVIDDPFAAMIIDLMRYLKEEESEPYSADNLLATLMNFPFIPLDRHEVSSFLYLKKIEKSPETGLSYRDFLTKEDYLNEKGLNGASFLHLSNKIDAAISRISSETIQVFFQHLLEDFGIMQYILTSSDRTNLLEVVKSLFDFIKTQSDTVRDYDLNLLLQDLSIAKDEGESVPLIRNIGETSGVNLMTCHGAKGLEFDTVFVINSTKKLWEEKRKNYSDHFSMPSFFDEEDKDSKDLEEYRRLYYVAMTRAEKHLYCTYNVTDDKDREQEPSRFIEEIDNPDYVSKQIPIIDVEEREKAVVSILSPPRKKLLDTVNEEIISHWERDFVMNVTALNKYLECPMAFFYETVLRVPGPRIDFIGYGNAVHYTLQYLANESRTDKTITDELIRARFEKDLNRFHSHFTDVQFKERLHEGQQDVPLFYNEYKQIYTLPDSLFAEMKVETKVSGIPIKGNLDLVTVTGGQTKVIDYKTGKYKSEDYNSPPELGGKGSPEYLDGRYWRQSVFYGLLLENDPSKNWSIESIAMYYLKQKDNKWKTSETTIDQDSLDYISNLVIDTTEKIRNREFDKGCEREYCKWCQIANNDYQFEKVETSTKTDDYED